MRPRIIHVQIDQRIIQHLPHIPLHAPYPCSRSNEIVSITQQYGFADWRIRTSSTPHRGNQMEAIFPALGIVTLAARARFMLSKTQESGLWECVRNRKLGGFVVLN